MCGGRALLLLLTFLSHVASQHPPPFNLNGLVFNISTRVVEGADVCLHCEYFVRPQPHYGFSMIISFVEEASLTKAQVKAAASTQFLFPDNLRAAHEKMGKVMNKTTYTLSMTNVESVVITKNFSMSSKNAGSYICQMVPINATSTEAWTLTKWMRLEVHRGGALHFTRFATKPSYSAIETLLVTVNLFWSLFACAGLLICLFAICYCTCRPRRIVFKRVLIERSELYAGGAPTPTEGCRCARVTLVPETRPSARVYIKTLHRQREFDHLYGVEGICEGVKKKRAVGLSVQYLMPFDPNYEVGFGRVQVERRLGKGAFGFVYRGTATHLPGGITGPLPVAIKTLQGCTNLALDERLRGPSPQHWIVEAVVDLIKMCRWVRGCVVHSHDACLFRVFECTTAGSSEADVVAFVQEIEMMKLIGKHENVIQLYATSSHNGRPVVIMEYAAEGSLVDYLRRNRSYLAAQPCAMTESVLLRFALQVANGMVYLASKGIVHRDLAARNVVMTSDLVAKVADFGLTRKVELYYRMRGTGPVPLKWMAPESIFQKVFTTKSDVWSFGVLLWEVFSLGDAPAAAIPINEFLKLLHEGASLHTKPKHAGEKVFMGIMQPCWGWRPECRPTFVEVVATLSKLLQGS
ncbi:Fibroblast growth factor receptor 1 [Taenia solium]